nr:MAG TPA: hypothetical protein [Caudoviricetes sp.]
MRNTVCLRIEYRAMDLITYEIYNKTFDIEIDELKAKIIIENFNTEDFYYFHETKQIEDILEIYEKLNNCEYDVHYIKNLKIIK